MLYVERAPWRQITLTSQNKDNEDNVVLSCSDLVDLSQNNSKPSCLLHKKGIRLSVKI